MKMSQKNSFELRRVGSVLCLVLAISCLGLAQKDKSRPATGDVTGHYEGTAKNNAGEVINVALELTEKAGVMGGMIRSSHGDFTITGGAHHGDEVTLEFDANGASGSITLRPKEGSWVGTWVAGDDGGPVDVKKVAGQAGDAKGKS